jgi:hypothetical protein
MLWDGEREGDGRGEEPLRVWCARGELGVLGRDLDDKRLARKDRRPGGLAGDVLPEALKIEVLADTTWFRASALLPRLVGLVGRWRPREKSHSTRQPAAYRRFG